MTASVRWWMCIRASEESLSCVMLALLKVCSRRRALALLSHLQLVVGIVQQIFSKN